MNKKFLTLAVCGLTAASMLTACGKTFTETNTTEGESSKIVIGESEADTKPAENVEIVNFTAPENGDTIVEINFKDYGTVKIRLFPDYAPTACDNFTQLIEKGYYDGLTFHRIIKDFMIQGGDPEGNGMGGESTWGGSFDGGKYYNLIHAAGAVAYANSGSTATNGSQFYIVTGEVYDDAGFADTVKEVYKKTGGTPFLDGGYTVFGQVIDGLDVVFEIQKTLTDDDDKPLADVVMESVTVEEYDGSEIKWYISDYSTDDAEETDTENTSETEENTDTEIETTENTEETTEEITAEATTAEAE